MAKITYILQNKYIKERPGNGKKINKCNYDDTTKWSNKRLT